MDSIKTPLFTLAFGDKTFSCSAETIARATSLEQLNKQELLFEKAQHLFDTKTLILPQQTHGTDALVITSPDELKRALATITQADIVITTIPHIAVGVLTADCLPLLLVDPVKKAVAAVHAGWRGTVARIAGRAVQHLQKIVGSNPATLHAYLGPCAHVESYPASPELMAALTDCPFIQEVIQTYAYEKHFDISRLNLLYLKEAGLPIEHIHCQQNIDTITNQNYWSYRRDAHQAGRQLSAICLKKGVSHDLTPPHLPY